MSDTNVTEGTVAFSNITQHDTYNGKSTGKYNVVVTLDEGEAAKLDSLGVKLKEYTNDEGVSLKQRKFASAYDVRMFEADGTPTSRRELGRGSKIRIQWKSAPNEDYGTLTYLNAIKVLEEVEFMDDATGDF